MEEQSDQSQPPDSSGFKRQPPGAAASAAIAHMRACAKKELARVEDFRSELLLPVSCVLLIAAIFTSLTPQAVKAAAFLAPLAAFTYYIYLRIGIASTFNSRQAFMSWHLFMAIFLLGGTFSLFGLYVLTCITKLVLGVE